MPPLLLQLPISPAITGGLLMTDGSEGVSFIFLGSGNSESVTGGGGGGGGSAIIVTTAVFGFVEP